jgi:preprotein translocase SecE subunit
MALEIYKHGQGKYTRLWSGVGAAVIIGLGCYRLYEKLGVLTNNLWLQTMIPTVVFVVLAGSVFWTINRPSVADFMIAAEGEVKKVSWSSRQEIAVSTFIVMVVVVFLALLLGTSDLILQVLFNKLLAG